MTTKEIVLRELMQAAAGDVAASAVGSASAGGAALASATANDVAAGENSAASPNVASFLSGQELADRCGISRQAVWKAVDSLRKDGIQIEAVTNGGYKFVSRGDVLSGEAINALLPESLHAAAVVYDTIDSTNSEAKRRCSAATDVHTLHGTVIISDMQTAGRGRLGRSFFSPQGTGLYLSIIYAPETNIAKPSILTASAAVAVCRAISDIYKIDAKIKWVNDIFLGGKKICGILTEGATNFETGQIDYAIIGIGINILPGSFPPEIADVAASIFSGVTENARRNEFAAAIIKGTLEIFCAGGGIGGIKEAMSEYRKLSFLIGKEIFVSPIVGNSDNKYTAKVLDITDDAKLVVQKNDGTVLQLDSGEVTLNSSSAFAKNS